jgi:asparagine N-glycosylation enzyme membrane subunit Stt3
MTTPIILAVLAVVFAVAALRRRRRPAPDVGRQARTWFVVAAIFAAVSAWLWVAR